jgi:type II secretory pathway pseudopilin PulG
MNIRKWRKHNRRGFTAVEIIMVMTILFLLAVMVLPRFWKRTEEEKVNIAYNEMREIIKQMALIIADNDYPVRIMDMDASKLDGERPFVDYSGTERPYRKWRGPYLTFQEARTSNDNAPLVADPNTSLTIGGSAGAIDPTGISDPWNHIPNDPWGNDYIFGYDQDREIFRIISLGPDGLPDSGADGQPGISGVDDDNANGTDDFGELHWIGSDDETDFDDLWLVD